MNLFLLHDFTTEECDLPGEYYGIPNNAQLEAFLCTLGLRLADGTPRPAWQAVNDAAMAAGLRARRGLVTASLRARSLDMRDGPR